MNKKQQPRSTLNKRSHGRNRWEVERADEEARMAREEAEAAETWQRATATPPGLGDVLEVERTYVNWTVKATDRGEPTFLARDDHTGTRTSSATSSPPHPLTNATISASPGR